MKITNTENETIFDLKYTLLVFQTYNEEFFKSKGIDATVSIVMDKEELMKGGGSHKIDMSREDKVTSVPYAYFEGFAKYIVKLITGSVNEGYSAFVEVFKRMPVLSNYIKKEPIKIPSLPGSRPTEEEKKEPEPEPDPAPEPEPEPEPAPEPAPEPEPEPEPEQEPEPEPAKIPEAVMEEKAEVKKEPEQIVPPVIEEEEVPPVTEPEMEKISEKQPEAEAKPTPIPEAPKQEDVQLTPMPEEVKQTLLMPSDTKILRIKVMTTDVREINTDELFYPKLERSLKLGIFGKEFSIAGKNVIIGEESIMCMDPVLLKKIYGTMVYKIITDGECKPLL